MRVKRNRVLFRLVISATLTATVAGCYVLVSSLFSSIPFHVSDNRQRVACWLASLVASWLADWLAIESLFHRRAEIAYGSFPTTTTNRIDCSIQWRQWVVKEELRSARSFIGYIYFHIYYCDSPRPHPLRRRRWEEREMVPRQIKVRLPWFIYTIVPYK